MNWTDTVATDGCRIFVDIMTGGNYRQFRLLFPMSIIDRAIYPDEGRGWSKGGG